MAGGRFKNIFEGESVEAFMAGFALDDAAREKAAARYPGADFSAFPKTVEAVLEDVKTLWQEKGFMTPAALEAALIVKYIPDAPAGVLDFIRDIEYARNAPDPVTGYLPKEHAYAASGLAHLYTLETGKGMAMAEIDFSNMGGTNDYFREMLAAERFCAVEEVAEREARAMTDDAMLVICRGLVYDLKGMLPDIDIVPIRTGGDELRILIGGVSDPEMLKNIAGELHTGIEMRVAQMGLQDHPHLKDPENPVRNGFGAALAMQDMGRIVKTNALVQELDADISAEKKRLGLIRLGEIDHESQEQGWLGAIESGKIKVPEGQDTKDFIDNLIARDILRTAEVSAALHVLNPAHNPALVQGSRGFAAVVEKQLAQTGGASENLFPYAPLREDLTHQSLAQEDKPQEAAPMASLETRRRGRVEGEMKQKGFALTTVQKMMLDKALSGIAAIDPAAGVMMPQVMAPTIEAWSKDSKMSGAHPQGMAVSFHNLAGLNGALGHHYSDIALRHMVGIIKASLEEAGISSQMPEPALIAHEGGANFTLVVADATPEAMAKAQKNIARRTEEFNRTGIAVFLLRNGVADTERLRDYLQREGLRKFADIKDPKSRTMEVEGTKVTGYVNGLGVVSAAAPVANDVKGYVFLDKLRGDAEKKMNALRQGALVNDFMAGVLKNLSLGEKFNTVAVGRHRVEAGAVYRLLPMETFPDMPPEVQSLVEIKKHNADGRSRGTMRAFERQYNALMEDGGLIEVGKWLEKKGPKAPKVLPEGVSRFGKGANMKMAQPKGGAGGGVK
ncbi:MAG: hypothetical protein GC185_12005 [Alphaproteobacteria bacterium]|nr:hypothetical protein [Alphaproteobacteria bacterium]